MHPTASLARCRGRVTHRGLQGALFLGHPEPTICLLRYTLAMVRMMIEMPEGPLASMRREPTAFAQELRLAAAVKWYEMRLLSQGRAAEVAGISRSAFIEALGRFDVSPFQYDADEILTEAREE